MIIRTIILGVRHWENLMLDHSFCLHCYFIHQELYNTALTIRPRCHGNSGKSERAPQKGIIIL